MPRPPPVTIATRPARTCRRRKKLLGAPRDTHVDIVEDRTHGANRRLVEEAAGLVVDFAKTSIDPRSGASGRVSLPYSPIAIMMNGMGSASAKRHGGRERFDDVFVGAVEANDLTASAPRSSASLPNATAPLADARVER